MKKSNFFVVGMPRSGSTLVTKCLNYFPDVVCASETFFEPLQIDQFFSSTRALIADSKPIDWQYDENGEDADHLGCYGIQGKKQIQKTLSEYFLLGHKGVSFWIMNIDRIIAAEIPILAVIRNPIPSICSWNTPEALKRMPICQMTEWAEPRGAYGLWDGLVVTYCGPPEAKTKAERRASLWNSMISRIYLSLQQCNRSYILQYENLVTNPKIELHKLSQWLQTDPPESIPQIDKLDTIARYGVEAVAEITEAVEKFAPMRNIFGYE